MPTTYTFDQIARLPMPGDNAAIATRRLEAGDTLLLDAGAVLLMHTVLEGHRFAAQPIAKGAAILSWELPFGVATRSIAAGEYLCNERTLASLRLRSVQAELPDAANFVDRIDTYRLDPSSFRPAAQIELQTSSRTFLGYPRSGKRGVGTRNFIVLIGSSSHTGGFVRALEERLHHLALDLPNLDGIVAVAHTEGTIANANNREHVLRALAGFAVHANVGAVLIVDYGWEPINNTVLHQYMLDHGYPLDDTPHHFLTLSGSFEESLAQAETIVRPWLPLVNAMPRSAQPLAQLKVALQCGGSDAFSGISANPLIGWLGREIVRCGGYANLTETPELIGAEPYILDKVKDLATAQRFLEIQTRFRAYAAAHGVTAEGNPSDGNRMRGLYNIALKSIGAARKKDPALRLDAAIDYAERMTEPGFTFMDSPGLDLESVAGQVASGCTVVFFTTGNGSVTNFPFVPTIKVVTTTRRFELLVQDMDVNAGRYLDGVAMDQLGADLLDLTVEVVSGQRTAGERAGHAQVQIWRNWQQSDTSNLSGLQNRLQPAGQPLPLQPPQQTLYAALTAVHAAGGPALQQVGLILPTSLCAAQVARMAADRLNHKQLGRDHGLSRFVSLSHTEGCAGPTERLSAPTLLGYATHPSVRHCLMLEHGCEIIHNDYMRRQLAEIGFDASRFGWASVQLDGGIARVMDKIEAWFAETIATTPIPSSESVGLGGLRLGLVAAAPLPDAVARAFASLATNIVHAGGLVVAGEDGFLLRSQAFLKAALSPGTEPLPTLAHSQAALTPGFHLMATQTVLPVEVVTGLGAAGAEIIVAYVGNHPFQSHPLMPVLQMAAADDLSPHVADDLDLVLEGEASDWAAAMVDRIAAVVNQRYMPRLFARGNIDFQIARGLLGISL